MTRQERVILHKKQETREKILIGKPILSEMSEGVPIVRSTPEGVAIFVKHNNVLYKSTLTIVEV